MIYGGMPYLLNLKTEEQKKNYLQSLFSEVYIKDISKRHKIERTDILEGMLDFLGSSIGSLSNPANITNTLNSRINAKVSGHTITDYLHYLEDAFLLREVKRYDIKGKHYFDFCSKYYYMDVGLRNARLNFRQFDPGHLMENILYNELVCRGYAVDVGVVTDRTNGQNKQLEIDFVVNQNDKRMYIQSAYQIDSAQSENRETVSLRLTGDFFRKVIIQKDLPITYQDENGILHLNTTDFLLSFDMPF